MDEVARSRSLLRRAGLAFGPFMILGALLVGLYLTSPFGSIEAISDADALSILWMLTVVGALAGVVPVMLGMLWYPFLRTLTNRWIYAVLALSAGVLTFAGVEMLGGIADHASGRPATGPAVAIVGVTGAFVALLGVSRWQYRKVRSAPSETGLQVAYLIAIGLGLHSFGEGLAIGTAFVQGDGRLVTLLVIAFILDNVTEGPTIVAAIARHTERPHLGHFVLMGVIAGGPVIVGGWVGSLAMAPLVAVLFFAIGLGAIIEVIWELVRFIGHSEGGTMRAAFTPTNALMFLLGFLVMTSIDLLLIDTLLL